MRIRGAVEESENRLSPKGVKSRRQLDRVSPPESREMRRGLRTSAQSRLEEWQMGGGDRTTSGAD